jgi:DNA-binding PadR family transcriptional regulator
MFSRGRLAVFRRGVLRLLILQSLSKKPMHGYEIMKNISEEFGGVYQPSAGAIYPTMQELEDNGYVVGKDKEGKKVYSITSKGMNLMKEDEEKFKAIIEKRKSFLSERKGLNSELRNIVSLIMTNYFDLKTEKADEIVQILKEARRKISDVIFE